MESDAWAWPRVALGSIAKFRAGSAFKTEHQGESRGDIPFIKVSDFSLPENSFQIRRANNWVSRLKAKEIKAALHPPGATVFAKIGVALTYNRRRLLTRETAIDNNLMSAAPTDKVSSEFLHLLLCHLDFNIIANGSALPYLNVSDLQKIEVGLPPREIQDEIAVTLMALQQRIDLLRQTNATLESIAQALFKSWFIDFDPVRAKAEGREPEGMDAATAALFPAEFEESALGLIPKGWGAGRIYEAADVRYGAPFASKLFNSEGDGLPLVRIRDLKDEAPGVWTPEAHPKGCKIRLGDIVVGMDGEFRAYLWGGEVAWMNQRICMFTPKNGHSAAFVRSAIAAPLAQVEATETATTVIHLGKADIDRFLIVIPTLDIAGAFGSLCQPFYDRIVANKQNMRSLGSVRDTLLPRLISGKLRLPDAQAQLEEAIA